jgi:hypothetical protein
MNITACWVKINNYVFFDSLLTIFFVLAFEMRLTFVEASLVSAKRKITFFLCSRLRDAFEMRSR